MKKNKGMIYCYIITQKLSMSEGVKICFLVSLLIFSKLSKTRQFYSVYIYSSNESEAEQESRSQKPVERSRSHEKQRSQRAAESDVSPEK